MNITKAIDTVNRISTHDFEQDYFRPQKPLLIKGLTRYYPAGKKWNISYLKSVCGNVKVGIFDNSIKNNTSSSFTRPDFEIKFGDYIDLIAKNGSSNLRIFLFNMFRQRPVLRGDFPCPYFFRGILGKIGYMFFGTRELLFAFTRT